MTKSKNDNIIPLPDLDKRPINKPRKSHTNEENDQAMFDFLASILNETMTDDEKDNDTYLWQEAKKKDPRRSKIIDKPKLDPSKTIYLDKHRKK